MMKACVIRLWAPTILFGAMAVSVPADRLEAQGSTSTAQTSPSATKPQSDKAGLTQDQRSQLQQASKLAGAGKYDAAMVIYRRVFGTHPPVGEWALAYYDTEAATEEGRPRAVAGLRALVEKYPGDSRYEIALGRVLTFNPLTRSEGRKYLAKFPNDNDAAEAFRQSLLWDAANPAMTPEIRAYLATHNDPQLAAVMQMTQAPPKGTAAVTAAQIPSRSGVSADGSLLDAPSANSTPPVVNPKPLTTVEQAPSRAAAPSPNANADTSVARIRAAAETAAYQALNASRMEEAEKRFKAILATDPGDSQALAGMGYVRMQQGNFMGAISFLEQARRNNSADKGLAEALETSRFWFIMSEGQQALSDNDLTTAERPATC